MGSYVNANGNFEKGTILSAASGSSRVKLCRKVPTFAGTSPGMQKQIRGGEYYFELVHPNITLEMSVDVLINLYDKQITSGRVEYNWLDDYFRPVSGEQVDSCPLCGKLGKSESELKTDAVQKDRSVYEDGVFYPVFDISSEKEYIHTSEWHEDCILADINPLINQAAQMCAAEGVLDKLRYSTTFDPEVFKD